MNELQVIEQNAIVQAYAKRGGTDELFDRISVVKKLDGLRNEILAPRDAWEQAEKDRVAKCFEFLDEITELAKPEFLGNAAWQLKGYIDTLSDLKIDSRFMEFEEQAKIAKLETLEVLRKALTDREKAEAEQREARLKAEKEAADLRAQQAAENERKRIEAEQFSQAEAARKAEEARLADKQHKNRICNEALKGLTDLGVDAELGKEILNAINKGLVPHVSIKF